MYLLFICEQSVSFTDAIFVTDISLTSLDVGYTRGHNDGRRYDDVWLTTIFVDVGNIVEVSNCDQNDVASDEDDKSNDVSSNLEFEKGSGDERV